MFDKIPRELIAQRAWEIYRASGCQPGRDLQNWLRAEQEVKKELAAIAAWVDNGDAASDQTGLAPLAG